MTVSSGRGSGNRADDASGARPHDPRTDALRRASELAIEYLATIDERPVVVDHDVEALRRALVVPLPEDGEDPVATIEALARDADAGIVPMGGPRYFGFVIGGAVPAALAADWLTSSWDQNAGLYVGGPSASLVEEAVGAWTIDLLGLPQGTSYGLTTGCQMAHFTCLGAARHAVLGRVGWNVERDGLFGAPEIAVVVGAEAHSTLHGALQFLGLGRERVHVVPTDEQGRMRVDALHASLARIPREAPLIVCLQAGNVNTGAFDPIADAIAVVRERDGAWIHVDGAFGMWAAVSPELRPLLAGVDLADSWATDAHKWLNVPYDSGLAYVAHPQAHADAMSPPRGAYLQYSATQERDQVNWVPEYSRRARGFAVYAALRSLGRTGVRDIVERCCAIARRMADALRRDAAVEILNDVVLNQVLVRFRPPSGSVHDADAFTRDVIGRIQREGTLWLSGTVWHDVAAMRISVSNWSTSVDDADRAVDAILRCVREAERSAT